MFLQLQWTTFDEQYHWAEVQSIVGAEEFHVLMKSETISTIILPIFCDFTMRN